MVLRIAIEAVVAATAIVAIWYFLFSRYNRRRGTVVLHWVEAACAARGRLRVRGERHRRGGLFAGPDHPGLRAEEMRA